MQLSGVSLQESKSVTSHLTWSQVSQVLVLVFSYIPLSQLSTHN